MTHDELIALPDVTPQFGYTELTFGGRKVHVPVLDCPALALFQKEDDGVFMDNAGVRWVTGWIDGVRVRQKAR